MNEIWQTLAKLIGLCFLEEMSCLFIHDEKLGKTVRLVFGLLFLAVLLGPLLNLSKSATCFPRSTLRG